MECNFISWSSFIIKLATCLIWYTNKILEWISYQSMIPIKWMRHSKFLIYFSDPLLCYGFMYWRLIQKYYILSYDTYLEIEKLLLTKSKWWCWVWEICETTTKKYITAISVLRIYFMYIELYVARRKVVYTLSYITYSFIS